MKPRDELDSRRVEIERFQYCTAYSTGMHLFVSPFMTCPFCHCLFPLFDHCTRVEYSAVDTISFQFYRYIGPPVPKMLSTFIYVDIDIDIDITTKSYPSRIALHNAEIGRMCNRVMPDAKLHHIG